jgi:hypothetical protein
MRRRNNPMTPLAAVVAGLVAGAGITGIKGAQDELKVRR